MINEYLNKYLVLAIGVLAVSFAAILIRLTDAPASVIAFYRMAFASILSFPFVINGKNESLKEVFKNKKYFILLLFASFFLAAHFGLWITSLEYTTVASSVVFVTTQPIFVALGSYLFLKERVSKSLLIGILIAISGSIVIGISDLKVQGSFLYGDLLALGGAIMIAVYLLIASKLRKKLDLWPYVFIIYSITALFLYLFVKFRGYSLIGYSFNDYIVFLLLAIGPNIIGHNTINWALKHISPSIVATSILGEPIGSTILAFLILHEVPPFGTLIGSSLILIGIYITIKK